MTTTTSKKFTFRSELRVLTQFPSFEELSEELGSELCLVYDEQLLLSVKGFKHWIRAFPCTFSVKSGESLKSLEELPKNLTRLTHLTENFSRKNMALVAIGGGSVGDFVGFVASILRRGVRLIQFPTTWLAVIDSAHGGKNALNVETAKNQIGTFHSAEKVFIVKNFFENQPENFAEKALGELLKIALLDQGNWAKELLASTATPTELFKSYFLKAIEAKHRIVELDPFELSGHRELLNLGHTVGHVLESFFQYPHGVAVSYGLLFSLEWSRHLSKISPDDFALLKKHLDRHCSSILLQHPRRTMDAAQFLGLLARDKKLGAKSHLNFIFLCGLGQPEIESVHFNLILKEAIRQGWVRT